MTLILTTPETWQKFREDCEFILNNANIPESWLAKLLHYRSAGGLHMSLRGVRNPSKEACRQAAALRRGLIHHMGTKRETT